ncbi:glycosyltransferase [Brachyspira hyodysenteriae]|nr:glycosyltransferase [Brachyspira hyodysenteriae]
MKREKRGLGPAYVAGFKHSFQYNPDYVIEMDADFSHDPDFVIKFIERMENEKLDLVIGSRYCNGISVVNWPLRRLFFHIMEIDMLHLCWVLKLWILQADSNVLEYLY